MEKYILTEKLDKETLIKRLRAIELEYADTTYLHKSGAYYYVTRACTVHAEGKDFLGVVYHPVTDNVEDRTITHSRTMPEFLNGNFTKVDL